MNDSNQQDIRFMRITYNENQWEKPSGQIWYKEKQGDPNTAYEQQYGFGHEEWLFSQVYRLNGYQHGFLQGVQRLKKEITFISKIYLFTINDGKTKLIAELHEVEILNNSLPSNVCQMYDNNIENAKQDLKSVGADYANLKDNYPNIRFLWEKAHIYDTPIELSLSTKKFNRYQPYKLTKDILENINSNIQKNFELIFKEGLSDITSEHTKVNKKGTSTVQRTHSTLVKDLFNYLKYLNNEIISAERSKISGKTPDVLIKHDEKLYSIFEVKTYPNAISNIREAIGQLFEYALLDESIIVKSLVIVGHALLNEFELKFFKRLQKKVSYKIEYWAYYQENDLQNKFKIIE